MKMKYETPTVDKLEFDYSVTVTASGATNIGPVECGPGAGGGPAGGPPAGPPAEPPAGPAGPPAGPAGPAGPPGPP